MAQPVRDLESSQGVATTAAVVKRDDVAAVPAGELGMFFRLASDPNVDITKFKELMALYREVDTQRRKDEYSAAFKAAVDEMKPVVVDRKNEQTNSMYATLEKVSTDINPIIKRHGFTMSYGSKEPNTPGNICVTCKVRHVGGWDEDYQLEGPPDDKGIKGTPNKTGIQGLVSSASYLRRVLKLMIWDITVAGLDRDGNKGSEPITDDQLQTINNMLDELELTQIGMKNFLTFAQARSVGQIKQHRYDEILIRLKEKLEQKRQSI